MQRGLLFLRIRLNEKKADLLAWRTRFGRSENSGYYWYRKRKVVISMRKIAVEEARVSRHDSGANAVCGNQ